MERKDQVRKTLAAGTDHGGTGSIETARPYRLLHSTSPPAPAHSFLAHAGHVAPP
ncbi:MAG: hypothetical protein ABIU05_20465 [Nitrospirales bacterium]